MPSRPHISNAPSAAVANLQTSASIDGSTLSAVLPGTSLSIRVRSFAANRIAGSLPAS